jgi:hypothetical protein
MGNAKMQCVSGACVIPCSGDHDCSLSSGAVPQLGNFDPIKGVCGTTGPNHYCQSVAGNCGTDLDCIASGSAFSVNMFCVTPSPPAVVSAVTN